MRHIIVKEKTFLKKLYKSKKHKTLEESNDNQIRAISYAVHLVLTKKVPLNQKIITSFLKINQKKINALKNQFGEKGNIEGLFNLRRKKQINILKHFLPLIKILLSAYFEKEKSSKKGNKEGHTSASKVNKNKIIINKEDVSSTTIPNPK